MFSTDQTHLRRYLTTLGVAVAAGTLSLAGLFLKLQQDMLVTRSTLAQLTPTARVALLERQRYLAFGTSVLPYFVLVGFVGGLSLAAYGLIGWTRRQKVTDELEDLALRRGQVELRQMTAQEQAEKLDREAEESVADIAQASAPQDEQFVVEHAQQLASDFRNRAVILEASLRDKLGIALGEDGFQTSIRASGPTGRVTIDALARVGKQNYVFELKYANLEPGVIGNAYKRINDALAQVDRGVRAIEDSGASNVHGVVIFVASDSTDDDTIASLVSYADRALPRFGVAYRVLVMRYSDFLSLSPNDLVSKLSLDSGPYRAA